MQLIVQAWITLQVVAQARERPLEGQLLPKSQPLQAKEPVGPRKGEPAWRTLSVPGVP
jgi:hypothetical protein